MSKGKKIRIGINGLGRIGRCVARAIIEEAYDDIILVAANGAASNDHHTHLLQYDSVHGRFAHPITFDDLSIDMGRGKITITHERDPNKLDWKALGVDMVLECTGAFNSVQAASVHLARGASHVLISAPAGDDCPTYVYGVNDAALTKDQRVISVGSCTTNALAPVVHVLHQEFGIVSGHMTTIHSYTGDQNLVDGSHKDLRRARAAGMAMVPTKTGAAKAIGLVIPELAGKLAGTAIRVPTPNVSMVDLTVLVSRSVTKQEVNDAFAAASTRLPKDVLRVDSAPLVSIDYTHNNASTTVDLTATNVVNGTLVRVASWYDNEWGFSCRMLDVARRIG
jgi:glyceraldehyde 3-phosphate dehydrogenase